MKIFISYKREDKEIVFPIVKKIREIRGVDCWIDLEGIESGDQFENVIIHSIKRCDIVIFMMSKQSIAPYVDENGQIRTIQTWTEKEVKYAINMGKRVIPVSLDGTSVKDCDWLSFNCSGLDVIDIQNRDQELKFFGNLLKWASGNANFSTKTKISVRNPFTSSFGKSIILLSFVCTILFAAVYEVVKFVQNQNDKVIQTVLTYQTGNKDVSNIAIDYETDSKYIIERTQAVDLGLPSRTIWAAWNVGSVAPEEYGRYYSWGEVSPKNFYSLDTYFDPEYKIGKDIRGTKYDAATANWGQEWTMPSIEQKNELLKLCEWYWARLNNINGFVVKGPNGKCIFLPASGCYFESISSSMVSNCSVTCYYWCGEQDTRESFCSKRAACLIMKDDYPKYYDRNGDKQDGKSIRPVMRRQ